METILKAKLEAEGAFLFLIAKGLTRARAGAVVITGIDARMEDELKRTPLPPVGWRKP